MDKSLETTSERLSLVPLTEDDHQFIYELVNTKGWLTFIGDRNVGSPAAAIDYILKILDNDKVCYWVARLKDSGTPIGVVTFIQRDYLEHPDIGFAFLPQFSGKGYACEAAQAVLNAVIASEKIPCVLATTIPGNIRSIQLLQKIGLSFEREILVGEETLHVYKADTSSL